jgi:hypothetical protein
MSPIAMYQLTNDPAHVSDRPFLVLIILLVPTLSWFSVRQGRILGLVAASVAAATTAFVIHSISNAVRTGSYLLPDGPDYFYLGLSFAAGSLPWIAIQLAHLSRKTDAEHKQP